ncbi:MAG: PqqD family peptide modification chaperone [Caulobacterales bacterium]
MSIASYRDPQLAPTIEDCLAKARFPQRLRFGVCWQHGPEEVAPSQFADARFRVLDVDWRDSRGACWARAEVMKLWRGEDWFLQLDSHHRFVSDWDVKLLAQAAATGSAKPLLTTYATPFAPGHPDILGEEPMLMAFDRFTEDGLVLFRPAYIPQEAHARGPVPARFVSAHFLLAPGRFVEEVPYDPELYFIGEEITLTVRAFTHGYDLFHPSEIIVWHEYTRAGRNKHWDDHSPENRTRQSWDKLDPPSRAKARTSLLSPDHGRFGCGRVRTLTDYEAYAGLNFLHCRAQDYTRRGLPAPNPPPDPDWVERTRDWCVQIAFDASRLPDAAWRDSQFWFVCVHDSAGGEIYRQDADEEEIRALLVSRPARIEVVRRFESQARPSTWTVLPHCKSTGWVDARITGAVDLPAEPYPCTAPGLWVAEADAGFLVTNPRAPGAKHLLNRSAVLLLEFANGRHSLSEIVEAVRELYALPNSPERDVRDFFDLAARSGLIANLHAGGVHG